MKKTIIIGVALTTIPSALGYIDPGTGGMIASSAGNFLYMILIGIGGFMVHKIYNPVKGAITGLFKRK